MNLYDRKAEFKMDIEDQFLNKEGLWITKFKTENEYEKQLSKVRKTIRETTTDRDFDILIGYHQLLKRSYSNMLLENERY